MVIHKIFYNKNQGGRPTYICNHVCDTVLKKMSYFWNSVTCKKCLKQKIGRVRGKTKMKCEHKGCDEEAEINICHNHINEDYPPDNDKAIGEAKREERQVVLNFINMGLSIPLIKRNLLEREVAVNTHKKVKK